MRLYNDYEELTPMKLLIRSMPGIHYFVGTVVIGNVNFTINWLHAKISVLYMLNKNTLGVKKVRGQSEAALQTGATKNFDIS